ncbi:MAG: AAA family ATPase [Hydrogenophaga sp.]|uniref:McrB family protein n=1 Tax=Hydrogenophaga sp. TaxID=1904254 RepID=UPI0027160B44|nr:AAA family ATPase [Hydrogenophaga sp.]MDO9483885.1 AAA family ATPase [Hydrogenophaga sp.]MDP1894456.1 AAA family ATPase [Hydrogenophaga sp.]MDP3345078.1 AAA family ATPase [Hydrogenophaga sp.]MDP3805709.1 AAA family ATPase [Hydrogenophaga sp.]MDP3924466.1 AAA family ATPase [Hydrogenophaga sp.]
MSDFQKQYALWDEFLSVWPASRLATMTLDEYSLAGSKDSFTYWIESRLDELGSIWGGSSFKFGVFSRKNLEARESAENRSYSDTHGWYSSLGGTAEDAFERVRGYVAQIANLTANGDLDGIEAFDHLGEATKWKIAFHYQNRQAPVIVDIFKKAPLAVFAGSTAGQSMSALQKATLAKRPSELGILEFGRQVWEAWSQKNLAIWKLSHGNPPNFIDTERQKYLERKLAVMHRDTGQGQGKEFEKAPVGALLFLCHSNSPQLIAQFTSEAMDCDKGDGWLKRSYRVLKPALRNDRYTANAKKWSPQGNSTFWQVGAHDLPEFESTLLKPFFGTDLAEVAALAGEPIEAASLGVRSVPPTPSATVTGSKSTTASCFNRIYYGPPGTGKTYTLMQLLKRGYEPQAASITPEEWRTQIIAEKVAVLKWWEGAAAALYDLGGKAKVADIAGHPFIQAIEAAKNRTQGVKQTLWGTLQHHTIETSATVNTKLRMSPSIFDKTVDSEWQFAGDWPDACADLITLVDQLKAGQQDTATVQRYSFVTFHQSYGYEEFVEGLRPVLNGDAEAGEVEYEIRSGAFKELCRKARQAPDQRFAMVIDEINRGNISKIFGELITLIEPDKRDPLDGSKPALELTLAYSGEKFSVPANVDIIGTMNTADRSLALLDTALRRRFDFVPLLPDTRAVKDVDDPHSAPLAGLAVATSVGAIDVRQMLERINERIEALYDRDHCIGHAYLTALANVNDGEARFEKLTDIFRNRIVPLLEEYFFEDWRKIRLVLGDNQKPQAAQFITESDAHEQDLSDLFGNNHGLDSYATKRRYQSQPSAFANPAAYLGIYQSLA